MAKNITWVQLNDALRSADLAACITLFEAEKQGPRRILFLRRIDSRIARLNRQAQYAALAKLTTKESTP